jgi:hypothetical protein
MPVGKSHNGAGSEIDSVGRCKVSHSLKGVLRVMGIAVLILGLVLIFSGCGGGSGSIVGKWSNAERGETIEFTSDGRMLVDSDAEGSFEFTYKIDGNSLVLGMEGFEATTPTAFSLDGDTLTVTDPDKGPMVYKRR